MSDFTITNLKQLKDSAGARMPGSRPASRASISTPSTWGVTYLRYEPGVFSPMVHSHRTQEEGYVVIGGSGTIVLNEKPHAISRWDVIRVSH